MNIQILALAVLCFTACTPTEPSQNLPTEDTYILRGMFLHGGDNRPFGYTTDEYQLPVQPVEIKGIVRTWMSGGYGTIPDSIYLCPTALDSARDERMTFKKCELLQTSPKWNAGFEAIKHKSPKTST